MHPPIEPHRALRLRPDAAAPLEALLVAAGPHLEAVLDVGTGPGGDLLVELPLPRSSLPALLAIRDPISPGEAVTLLVPLLEASASMHGAGVAHGAIGIRSVLLSEEGAPYWAAPEAPVIRRLVPPDAFRRAVDEDRAALTEVADAILRRAALPVLPQEALTADRVFALAEPEPVRFAVPEEAPDVPVLPQRLVPPRPAPAAAPGTARTIPDRARALGASVRPRVWAAAGAAVGLLLLAVVLLPSGRGDAAVPVSASGQRPIPAVPSRSAALLPASVPRGTAPSAAVRALLTARSRCLAAGDGSCLERVAAPGSPLLTADRAAITAGSDPVTIGRGRVVLRASGGGTALADVGGATVLAARQPDGWRLRDVIAPR